ncbi:MAG: hypothetical protein LBR69_02980, partial [Endomicrobium sp.]|nr:hypothetical protein [Endomicrobium sp.]
MAFDPTKWIAEHDTATNKSAGFDPEAWIKEYDSKPAAGKTKVENQFDPEKWIADYDAGNNNKTAFSTAVDAVLKPFSVASDAAAIKQPKPRQPLELSLRAPVKADTERLAAAQEPSVFDYQINRIAENIAPAIERTSSIEELQKQQKKQNFLMRTAPAIATVGVGAMPLSIAAAYEALQQGRNFAVQKAKGEKYNPIDSRTFAEILPEGTPEAARIGTTMLEMLGDMALVGKGASLSKKVLLDDALRVAENKLLSAGYEIDDIARNSVRGKQFIKSNYKKITPEEALEINIRTRTAEIPKVNKEAPGTAPKPASISEPIRPAGSDITSRPQPQSTVSPDNTIQQPVSPVRSQNQPIQSAREIIQREERKEHLRQEIDYLTELMNTEDRIQQAAYDKLQINLNNVVTEYEQLNNPEGVEVAAQEEVVNIPTDNSSGRNNFRIYSENFENTIGGKIRIPEKGSVNRGEYDSLSPRIKRRFFTTNQNAITFDEAEQLLQESGRDIKIWDYLQNIERNTTKYRRAKVNISAKEDAEFAGAESGQYKDAATQWEKKGTDSPYFKKWFGDSKVVDNSGKPLVVYHGTDEVFNEFINRDILDLFGNTGFNFTDSKAIADTFSDIPTNTLAVYLDIKNPKVYERSDSIDAATAMRADILGDVKSGQTITKATNDFRERLIAEGFDGIILHDTVRDAKAAGVKTSNHFIVFDPSQIKSTNNQGTFDPENANIYYRKSDKKQLTEGIKANIEGIRQLNKELFGDDNLRIVRKIFAEDSQEALGRYRDGMIDIVEGQANPKETLYHEAVHKYADMFLTEDERKAIFAETLRKTGIRNQEKLEERVAEDFIEYANDRQGFTGRIKMLFEKLLDRIKAFFGKENKVRKMYNDILSGKAAKMQAGRARNLKAETESAFRDKEYNTVEKKLNYVIDDIKNKKTDINFSVKAGKVDIKIRNLVKKELGKDISEYVHKIYKNDLIHIKNRHIGGRQNDLTYNDLKLIPQIIKNYDAVSVDKNKTPPRLRYEKKYNDGSYFYVEQILGESKKELASKTMYKKEPPSERGTDTNIKSAPSSNGFRVAAEPTPNGGNKSITEKENDVKFRALPDPDKFKDSKIVNAVQRAIGSKQAQTFKIKQRWDNIVRGMQKQGITSYQDNVDLFNYYDNPKEYPLPADLKNKIGQDLLNEILNFKKMMTNEQVRRGLLENVWKDDAYMRRYIVNIDDTPLTALQLDKLKKSQPWSDRAETEPEAEQKIKDYRNEIKDLNEQLKNTQESDAAFSLKGKIKNRENQIEELNDLLKRYREQ